MKPTERKNSRPRPEGQANFRCWTARICRANDGQRQPNLSLPIQPSIARNGGCRWAPARRLSLSQARPRRSRAMWRSRNPATERQEAAATEWAKSRARSSHARGTHPGLSAAVSRPPQTTIRHRGCACATPCSCQTLKTSRRGTQPSYMADHMGQAAKLTLKSEKLGKPVFQRRQDSRESIAARPYSS
jgi:hypothetical protein